MTSVVSIEKMKVREPVRKAVVSTLMLGFIWLVQMFDANAADEQKKRDDAVKRDHIKIVGSSSVYPYTKRVAEAFVKKYGSADPVIKNDGSGGGLSEFCGGTGLQFPDIANASRPMKKSEWQLCERNGVKNITEIYFGNDGLTLIKSKFGERLNLTRLQLYKATASKVPLGGRLVANPYVSWYEIDDNLPDVPIQIFGPTSSHGSYSTFVKMIIREACKNDLRYFQKKKAGFKTPEEFASYIKNHCSEIRRDGAYLAADQPISQTLKFLSTNPKAIAIVGYSELFNRRAGLQAVRINGVEPRIYTISDRSYLLSRPLYFYIKNEHRELVPDISLFVKEFMSMNAMGSFGYLVGMGLGVRSVVEMNNARYAATVGMRMRRYLD